MEDKLIDTDVLTELKGRMKENRVIPDLIGDFTVEDLRNIDPKTYETCLGPTMTASSVMPEPVSLASREDFKDFMDELITYVENPTPAKAVWIKGLQRRYNISVLMTDYPEQFSVRVLISMTGLCDRWLVAQWDEMVPYEVADIIQEAVNYL